MSGRRFIRLQTNKVPVTLHIFISSDESRVGLPEALIRSTLEIDLKAVATNFVNSTSAPQLSFNAWQGEPCRQS